MKKTRGFLLTASIVLATTFTLSCSSDDEGGGGGGYTGSYGSVKDAAGKSYKTVQIGTQTWMAENLNYNAEDSKCYGNDPANCVKYGRMYDWETAKTVCPSGWHLPSSDDWEVLVNYVGDSTAGTKLKAKDGWSNNGNGTDNYGFSALPGGGSFSADKFEQVGSRGNWWSATATGNEAYLWDMRYNSSHVNKFHEYRSDLLSVRCVKD